MSAVSKGRVCRPAHGNAGGRLGRAGASFTPWPTVLTLVVLPVLYFLWLRRRLEGSVDHGPWRCRVAKSPLIPRSDPLHTSFLDSLASTDALKARTALCSEEHARTPSAAA